MNCEKFNIHVRNKVRQGLPGILIVTNPPGTLQIVEDAARERFNDYAAQVLRATLKATEAKQLHVADVRSGSYFMRYQSTSDEAE